ncbi:MAG TPA: Gfo/Idh/MocA family oxidoreductase [Gemmataceae bacterium]|nr:Gfo/Idh/MocA family oxidoreductase [Gemmataceae bacterium]
MSRRTNRRQFIQQTGLAGLGFWVAGGLTPAFSRSPIEKLNIAGIGINGKGSSDIDQAGNHGNVVAICDIDDRFLEKKGAKFPKAKKYNDFRKMLDEMGKSIDAVTVSTPDHTHAVAAMMAIKMGKHVYCQKPLTHTVREARELRLAAKKYKVCTQMGNQGSAENGLREAVEVIQAGAIGPVTEAHVWTNRPIWPQAPKLTKRPEPKPEPKHVHWDLWLGPAPERPYADGYHTFAWRGFWDFGTGALGDMACHTANMAFRALKLGYPTSISAENGKINPETYPGWATITFQFPARADGSPPVKFVWYEGHRDGQKNLPPKELFHGENPPGSGSLLVGKKGILYSPNDYGAAYKLLPKKEFEGFKKPEKRLPRNGRGDDGMKEEWVRAIMENKPEIAYSNFDFAGLLTETILLGNVAMRAGKKLAWDGEDMKFPNYSEAEKLLHFEYRKGWTL